MCTAADHSQQSRPCVRLLLMGTLGRLRRKVGPCAASSHCLSIHGLRSARQPAGSSSAGSAHSCLGFRCGQHEGPSVAGCMWPTHTVGCTSHLLTYEAGQCGTRASAASAAARPASRMLRVGTRESRGLGCAFACAQQFVLCTGRGPPPAQEPRLQAAILPWCNLWWRLSLQ